jgi:hypothetical protein
MKTVRALIGLLVVAGIFYTAWMLIPVYYHNLELQDAMGDEARMNSYTNKSEDDMRESIYRKAKDMEIPITRDQINVRRDGQTVSIWVDYTVRFQLPGYSFDLQFHPSSKNKAI